MYNEEQIAVINHTNGPAAVLAGAGSGKTKTIIGRIERLSHLTSANRIVALTFTNPAADEMKIRAAKVNNECKNIVASTYHKYCGTMLRKYGKAIGIEPSYEILTSMAYKTFIEYIKSSNEYYEGLKDFPSALKLETIFSQMVNTDIPLRRLIYNTKYSKYEEEIFNLYQEVKQAGLEQQKLCFDDMLVYMNKLLDIPEICEKIANSFDYLMVDEFQDTNDLQLKMLLKLSKYNYNIVIVGDISQSIYKFRGAKVQNIQEFIDTFTNCEVFTLSTNYRSTQEILDATNEMMNNNVRSWTYTDMKSENNHGDKPVILHHANDYQQANWIIERIKTAEFEGYDYSQIAIIERKSMSSFKLENELLKAKIPFIKRGGKKLTEYIVVDDILSFLGVVVKKSDKFGWFNVLRLIPKIGNKTATEISKQCNDESFLLQYGNKSYGDKLSQLYEKIQEFRGYTKDPLTLFDKVLEFYFEIRTYKVEHSKMNSSAKFDAEEKIQNDKRIAAILKDMASNYTDIAAFLEDIALDNVNDENGDDKVVITTIHSAKGLEWPIVIIIDSLERDNYEDEEEELRCLYVAMTRAEEELTISVPDVVITNGLPMYNEVIHFIDSSSKYFREVS